MVALRKESVDRNIVKGDNAFCQAVALRKESVDRNILIVSDMAVTWQSLSARRAWIEILRVKGAFIWERSRSPQGERG